MLIASLPSVLMCNMLLFHWVASARGLARAVAGLIAIQRLVWVSLVLAVAVLFCVRNIAGNNRFSFVSSAPLSIRLGAGGISCVFAFVFPFALWLWLALVAMLVSRGYTFCHCHLRPCCSTLGLWRLWLAVPVVPRAFWSWFHKGFHG